MHKEIVLNDYYVAVQYGIIKDLVISSSVKIVNLILLDENPLYKISNTKKIFGVITRNKWSSKSEIDNRLKEIAVNY